MPQYIVNYNGIDYESPDWLSALKEARTIVDSVSGEPDCISILSLLRITSEEECIKSGSSTIYRVITKHGIQPVLVVYVS